MFGVLVVMMILLTVALVVALMLVNSKPPVESINSRLDDMMQASSREKKHDPFAEFSEQLFKDDEVSRSEKDDSGDKRA